MLRRAWKKWPVTWKPHDQKVTVAPTEAGDSAELHVAVLRSRDRHSTGTPPRAAVRKRGTQFAPAASRPRCTCRRSSARPSSARTCLDTPNKCVGSGHGNHGRSDMRGKTDPCGVRCVPSETSQKNVARTCRGDLPSPGRRGGRTMVCDFLSGPYTVYTALPKITAPCEARYQTTHDLGSG